MVDIKEHLSGLRESYSGQLFELKWMGRGEKTKNGMGWIGPSQIYRGVWILYYRNWGHGSQKNQPFTKEEDDLENGEVERLGGRYQNIAHSVKEGKGQECWVALPFYPLILRLLLTVKGVVGLHRGSREYWSDGCLVENPNATGTQRRLFLT